MPECSYPQRFGERILKLMKREAVCEAVFEDVCEALPYSSTRERPESQVLGDYFKRLSHKIEMVLW